jgi:hypothetical protein
MVHVVFREPRDAIAVHEYRLLLIRVHTLRANVGAKVSVSRTMRTFRIRLRGVVP